MCIRTITKVNIGYIPGYNCSKDRKTHHPLCRWRVFLSGGLGGEAHEQVAPYIIPTTSDGGEKISKSREDVGKAV